MRRIATSPRSIDLLSRSSTQKTSTYLCSICALQNRTSKSPFSTSATTSAKEKSSFTESLRRKIWGTDSPPGLADPYGGKSAFDKSNDPEYQAKLKAAEAAEEQKEARGLKERVRKDKTNYEPAETWDGLERVGGFGGWWKENWDGLEGNSFIEKAFLPGTVMTERSEITRALRRATVEVLALKEADAPLQILTASLGKDLTWNVQVVEGKLVFENETGREDLMRSLAPPAPVAADETVGNPTESQEDVEADRSTEDPLHPEQHENPTESEENIVADKSTVGPLKAGKMSAKHYEKLEASWGRSWLEVSIQDPEVKFAIFKRTIQLTGIHIPDSILKPAKATQSLLSHLVKPPRTRKVIDAVKQNTALTSLPNVQVFANRITPIDKEKRVGRWKIIEQELRDRELPVTGHR